jgi:hypothetical protein
MQLLPEYKINDNKYFKLQELIYAHSYFSVYPDEDEGYYVYETPGKSTEYFKGQEWNSSVPRFLTQEYAELCCEMFKRLDDCYKESDEFLKTI